MPRILVVRLGAMGDIIHTLPAAATLRKSFPGAHITWLVEPRWRALLAGNPHIDEVAEFDRSGGPLGMARSAWALRKRGGFDLGIDFQGLLKSASALLLAGAVGRWGQQDPREKPARLFYTRTAGHEGAVHVVEQHLALTRAAGAAQLDIVFPVPAGRAEPASEQLPPDGQFMLASPLAGWGSKQWPAERFAEVARGAQQRFGWPLVLNLPDNAAWDCPPGAVLHRSSIEGLIDVTRRAGAVVGVDSGPVHLAAALGKPGVAIFGPTDPARNGPYGGTFTVLREPGAATSHRRDSTPTAGMRAISAEAVLDALERRMSNLR